MKNIQEMRKPDAINRFKSAVSHLDKVDNRDLSWQTTLNSFMDEFGFKVLGAGKYGAVFEKAGYPYVIKVFMRDTAYLKWLDFCKKNQDNPWVPKIKGKVVKIGSLFMAVRLEKLHPGNVGFYDLELKSEDDPKLLKVIDYLYDNQPLMDMHAGNIMITSKGHPVIIDAFYNWYKNNRFVIDPDDISQFKSII